MTKPYVYIIQNSERTHWYVGYKQKPKTGEDYWGSSDYLDELIAQTGKENWTKTIIKEFDTWQEAKAHEDELLGLMWDWPGRVNKAKNGFVDHNDPEVKAKHRAGIEKAHQEQEVKNKFKAAGKKRSEDPEYRATHRAAMLKRAKPFIATNIATGEEYYCESLGCEQAKTLELTPQSVSNFLNGSYSSTNYKGFTFRYV